MTAAVIKTAQRVLELFEAFDDARRPLELREVTARFGWPPSSASMLLKSMVALGYLSYDRHSRSYIPTMRMPMQTAWVHDAWLHSGGVLSMMEQVHAETEETVLIGLQSDLYAQYVHVIPTRLPLGYAPLPKTVRPIARCGLGWLLLSAYSDKAIGNILRRINYHEPDPARRIQLPELMARIREIRRDGHVFSRHTVTRGAGIVARLLPPREDGRRLAVGVSGPVERLAAKRETILRSMDEALPRGAGDGRPRAAGSTGNRAHARQDGSSA